MAMSTRTRTRAVGPHPARRVIPGVERLPEVLDVAAPPEVHSSVGRRVLSSPFGRGLLAPAALFCILSLLVPSSILPLPVYCVLVHIWG